MTGKDLTDGTEVAAHHVGDALATGDLVIDAALRDLATVDQRDFDGHIEAAESLQHTLQARLANLGE